MDVENVLGVCVVPGYQEELGALKMELKCWENMFQRKHGRKPSKVSYILVL